VSTPLIDASRWLVAACIAGPLTCMAQTAPAAASAPATSIGLERSRGMLKAPNDRLSYATGVQTARTLLRNEMPIDLDALVQGIRDVMEDRQLMMSEKEMRSLLSGLQSQIHRRMSSDRTNLAARNKLREDSFLASHAKQADVRKLPGGVMVKVLQPSSAVGPKPIEDDTITMRYRGVLLDGTEFDATDAGGLTTMRLGDLPLGLRTAMHDMTPGAVWEVIVPSALGYGERGINNKIGPNETLKYTIELVSVISRR
jgi:FKBP-type peptidyl-prolyl cis-trans isomerase FklB